MLEALPELHGEIRVVQIAEGFGSAVERRALPKAAMIVWRVVVAFSAIAALASEQWDAERIEAVCPLPPRDTGPLPSKLQKASHRALTRFVEPGLASQPRLAHQESPAGLTWSACPAGLQLASLG